MRKSIILLVFLMIFLLISHGAAAADELIVWCAASPSEGETLIEAFEENYPDIDVKMIRAGSGEILTRLQAEQPRPSGDVILGIAQESFEGYYDLFEGYKTANHDVIPADLRDDAEDPKYYGYSLPLQAFIVNTDRLSEDEYPTSWEDLADEKYKGEVIMANPAMSGSAYSQVFQMYEIYGMEFLEKLVPNVVFVSSSTMVPEAVSRGEYSIGVTGEYNIADHIAKGSPVAAVYPEEGTGIRFDASGIVKNGPNPESARAFMDFLTTKEAYEIILEVRKRRTAHPEVATPAGLPAFENVPTREYDAIKAQEIREELTMDVSNLIE